MPWFWETRWSEFRKPLLKAMAPHLKQSDWKDMLQRWDELGPAIRQSILGHLMEVPSGAEWLLQRIEQMPLLGRELSYTQRQRLRGIATLRLRQRPKRCSRCRLLPRMTPPSIDSKGLAHGGQHTAWRGGFRTAMCLLSSCQREGSCGRTGHGKCQNLRQNSDSRQCALTPIARFNPNSWLMKSFQRGRKKAGWVWLPMKRHPPSNCCRQVVSPACLPKIR